MAQEVSDREPVRLSLRLLGETWSDPAISDVYASGGLLGGFGVVVPVWRGVYVEAEAGVRSWLSRDARNTNVEQGDPIAGVDDPRRFLLVPVVLMGGYGWSIPQSPVQLYGGAGPSFTFFNEKGESDLSAATPAAVAGTKIGAELRGGVRVDLGIAMPPPAYPPGRPSLRAVELEFFAGYRFSFGGPDSGFNLGAFRAGAGVVVGL